MQNTHTELQSTTSVYSKCWSIEHSSTLFIHDHCTDCCSQQFSYMNRCVYVIYTGALLAGTSVIVEAVTVKRKYYGWQLMYVLVCQDNGQLWNVLHHVKCLPLPVAVTLLSSQQRSTRRAIAGAVVTQHSDTNVNIQLSSISTYTHHGTATTLHAYYNAYYNACRQLQQLVRHLHTAYVSRETRWLTSIEDRVAIR
jgi:hypothetical protein